MSREAIDIWQISSDGLSARDSRRPFARETRAYGRSRLRELAWTRHARWSRPGLVKRCGWAPSPLQPSGGQRAPASARGIPGTKDDLGQALVMRETAVFFDDMRERPEPAPGRSAQRGAGRAAAYIPEADRRQIPLQTILTRAPVDGDTSLLPLLTTRGEPRRRPCRWFWTGQRGSGLAAGCRRAPDGRTCVARIGFSHIVTPTAATAVARDLALRHVDA